MKTSTLKYCDNGPLLDSPLWYHKQGLMQTASGYGSKLTNSFKTWFNGRWYRVYTMCYSNSGTCYIISKGEKLILTNTFTDYVSTDWKPANDTDYTKTANNSYSF